ncbi:ectonucleotide pyrophosphatase/phosphodiesterase family member 5-like isoform X1 [Adelges cooleyi]|uniref:ectonucleotide pyrophosphatase/phosphodiesterase family member 5-like isoform X1 n=1 Tax=Adelges cooleyi TaxID=133065 RepID=UPI00217FB363|nr:ectonucleotide pyrophosphatase/phosphodiesterase family member 5-like isoform X1 [Adelges cooleyi]
MFVATVVLLLTVVATTTSLSKHPLVLVVSFDGFRPDYVSDKWTPNLAKLKATGAVPPYMRNVFPTKTFVNHFSMATGLYPEVHGVLDNYMYDEEYQLMHNTYKQFHYNDRVIPIWTENEFNGDGRHSGVMMWIASEFAYQGKMPTHIAMYNSTMPWTSRLDQILSWFKDDKKPANLVYAYFEQPDKEGHISGIHSPEIKEQIVRVDATVKYLIDLIKKEGLETKINLIIVSDHGMESVAYDHLIYLNKYVDTTTFTNISTGPNMFIHPNPNKFLEVYKNLTEMANATGQFHVYTKENVLTRWHMNNSARLEGLIYLLAEPKYAFSDTYIENNFKGRDISKAEVGVHGYDNQESSMHAFFMAQGPAFKKNFTATPFDNVDLFPLVAHILNIKQLSNHVPTNGTITNVQQLLSGSQGVSILFYNSGTLITAAMFIHGVVQSF